MQDKEKAAYFAQYIGCDLTVTDEPKESWYPFDKNEGGLKLVGVLSDKIIVRRIAEDVKDKFHQCKLLLRGLESISDEDAIEVAKAYNDSIKGNPFPLWFTDQHFVDCGKSYANRAEITLPVFDYLRSKGYALPFRNHSLTALQSIGWLHII